MMRGKIQVVGVGPGHEKYILPAALQAIHGCDVLIGGKRNLEPFRNIDQEIIEIDGNLERICEYITQFAAQKKIAVLASGDPGIFSIQKLLRQKLSDIVIETIPGLSSLQYFCGKLGTSWDDLRIVSMHGRNDPNLAWEVRTHPRVCVFTGGGNSPGSLCRRLQEEGIGNVRVTVGERLSYPDERIVKGDLTQIGVLEFDNLAIMLIEHENIVAPNVDGFETPGLPDEYFVRGEAPMTKEEIRAISLSKLRLKRHDVVFDIGAGTGSVTVEAALRCQSGRVYAIEKDPRAAVLVLENVKRFGLTNVQLINGVAPEALVGLPGPDRVFIGGSDGKLPEVLERLRKYQKGLRVVINSITLETTYEAIHCLAENGFDNIETINVAISRSHQTGAKHIMKALNPVTIISADARAREGETS